jgi:hypothetical protein
MRKFAQAWTCIMLAIVTLALVGMRYNARAHDVRVYNEFGAANRQSSTMIVQSSAALLVTSTLTPSVTPTALADLTPTTTPTFVPTTASSPIITPDVIFLPLVQRQEFVMLQNGDFEEGAKAWQESSSKSLRLILQRDDLEGVIPHSGEWLAWLGGKSDELSILSQTVTVPPEQSILTYWKSIGASPDCRRDVASVIVNTIQLVDQFILCVPDAQAWAPHTVDLSLYAGTTITLQFRVDITVNDFPSSLYIDDIQWTSAATNRSTALSQPPRNTIMASFESDLPQVSRYIGKESKIHK